MTDQEKIDKFYADVDKLGMKFPGARIKDETGYSKGLISKYLKKQLEPSIDFIEKFYEKFGKSLQNVSREVGINDPIPLGDLNITYKDYFEEIKQHREEIKQQKEYLQELLSNKVKDIDSNLSKALRLVSQTGLHVESARAVVFASLERLEKKPNGSLADEAGSIVKRLMKERKKQGSNPGNGR